MEQDQADYLLKIEKKLPNYIKFPKLAQCSSYIAEGCEEQEKFDIIVNRRGSIEIYVGSYMMFHQTKQFLARLDLGPYKEHRNPPNEDGEIEIIKGPHVHIYKEEYGDKFAYPVSEVMEVISSDNFDLIKWFELFCKFCNIKYGVIDFPDLMGV